MIYERDTGDIIQQYITFCKVQTEQVKLYGPTRKSIKGGVRVPEGFSYTSDNNKEWMTIPQLREWIEKNRAKVGSI